MPSFMRPTSKSNLRAAPFRRRRLTSGSSWPRARMAGSPRQDIQKNWKTNVFVSARGGKLPFSWQVTLKPGETQSVEAAHNLDDRSPHPATKGKKLSRVGFLKYQIWLFTPDGQCFSEEAVPAQSAPPGGPANHSKKGPATKKESAPAADDPKPEDEAAKAAPPGPVLPGQQQAGKGPRQAANDSLQISEQPRRDTGQEAAGENSGKTRPKPAPTQAQARVDRNHRLRFGLVSNYSWINSHACTPGRHRRALPGRSPRGRTAAAGRQPNSGGDRGQRRQCRHRAGGLHRHAPVAAKTRTCRTGSFPSAPATARPARWSRSAPR